MHVGGLFSGDASINPYFHNANKVYLRFCSSDAWSGAGDSNVNGTLWRFQGLQIIASTVDTLIKEYGMGADGVATTVLLSGCSAGGQGVVNALDFTSSVVQSRLGSQTVVKGLADAGWMMDVEKFRANIVSVREQFISGYTLWHSQPNQNCVEAAASGQEYECLFSFVILHSSFDYSTYSHI
jgi:hypothetical protein